MSSVKPMHAFAVLAALLAVGQQPASAAAPMAGMATADPSASPSTAAFKAAGDKMMKEMAGPMTGDADQDFVAGMLPHHGGAVDMARVELRYGKDARMRRLARGIIAAQDKEIGEMRAWQRSHAMRP